MNKEITIIELLNKIANGEEVPKKIKYKNNLYIYNENCEDYLEDDKDYMALFSCSFSTYITKSFINDKVEIIEDNEDIEVVNDIITGEWENGSSYAYTLSVPQTVIVNKINELIKEVNKLRKENK